MKTIFVAAAGFLLLGGAAYAAPANFDASKVTPRNSAVTTRDAKAGVTSNRLQTENPTGLPAYEMRPDGLMINGLLPARGWEG
ncbi:MAG: hypothetical protein QOH05_1263 [Acetobacteraceae bacterium]|jgi:hypothetical protein|nr:hypothetical protein [Acetobacteraceae bacterium]